MQRKLFGVLNADVAVCPPNVIDHSVGIWSDLHVHVRAIHIEDALLAKLGARFQGNLLDLHYIVFNELQRAKPTTLTTCARFRRALEKSKSTFKMQRIFRKSHTCSILFLHLTFIPREVAQDRFFF